MIKYDAKRTGEENVHLLIAGSAKEGVTITEADVSFGPVTADGSVDGANSKITLSPVAGSTIVNAESPDLDRHYNRLKIDEVLVGLGVDVDTAVDLNADQDESQMIAIFIAASGIALQASDLTVKVNGAVATFTPVATHYGLIGSVDAPVKPGTPPELPELDAVFPEDKLSGFSEVNG